jgi:ubiquinone/menaquinone biosynthesis C-methylase UbiE
VSELPLERDAFRDFERAAHNRIAETYGALSVVTDRAAEPLLDAARVGAGTRLLDVAAGPGSLTRSASARGARAIGVDLSPAMVALARRLHPGLEFREASADALPFADASFDAVVCGFGIGHFSNAERVVAEFARVLAPRGFAALAWWQDLARNRINGKFLEVLRQLGVSAPDTMRSAPPFERFCDHDRFAGLLQSSGFDAVRIDEVSFEHRLRSADELWALAMGSFARVSGVILAQSADVQQQIRTAVAERAQQYASNAGLDTPVAMVIASGMRRP